MRCSKARAWISDAVDGALEATRAAELEKHIETCEECRGLREDLTKIVGGARRLAALQPSDAVWFRIRQAVERPGGATAEVDRPEPLRFWVARHRFALCAAVLLVAVATVLLFVGDRRDPNSPAEVQTLDEYTLVKLDEAQRHYKLAIDSLNDAIAAQPGQIDPDIEKTFEQNLQVVDASIRACESAARLHPRNLETHTFLLASYRQKVEMLTDLFDQRRAASSGTALERNAS